MEEILKKDEEKEISVKFPEEYHASQAVERKIFDCWN